MTEPAPVGETVIFVHPDPAAPAPEPAAETAPRAPGQPVAALACSTPQCTHRGRHVQIHDDTNLPVQCGGCATILHCDHAWEPDTVKATLEDPVHHEFTFCSRCKTVTDVVDTPATAAELLALLPIGTRTALGV